MRRTTGNAFVDREDSQLVADAKNVITEPVSYTYTEVTHLGHVKCFTSESYIFYRGMSSYTILGSGQQRKS